jgi:outer membrane protein assembly factor BamB
VGDLVPILPAEKANPAEAPWFAPPPAEPKRKPERRDPEHVADLLPMLEVEAVEDLPVIEAEPQEQVPLAQVEPDEDVPVVQIEPDEEVPIVADDEPMAVIEIDEEGPGQEVEEIQQAPPKPQEAPSWHLPPPVRHPAAVPELSPDESEAPAESVTSWQPEAYDPHVHGDVHAHDPHRQPEDHDHDTAYRPRRRWVRRLLILLLPLVSLGAIAVGAYFAVGIVQENEQKVAEEAQKLYIDGQITSAHDKWERLIKEYPSSADIDKYRFLLELSDLRAQVDDPTRDPADTLGPLETFITQHKDDPLLKPQSKDLGQSLVKLSASFAEKNTNPSDVAVLGVADRIQTVQALMRKTLKDSLTRPDLELINTNLGLVRQAMAKWQHQQDVFKKVAELSAKLSPADAIREIRRVQKAEKDASTGVDQAPEVVAMLNQVYDKHLGSVVYEKSEQNEGKTTRREDATPSIVFDTLLHGLEKPELPDDRLFLALARGVLYGLYRSNGKVRWAMRVGIDTTVLPRRIPATVGSSERILVLSADTETLTALDTAGNRLWRYQLSKPCLGQPVVIDQRAYLPTIDGQVHEIELARGTLLGRYRIGQRLTMGGVREKDSPRIYFPADDSCIYVLDVMAQRCQAILYSGHPSGSLRSEPLIVPPDPEGSPGYLILNQTHGLDSMQMRVFELPVTDRNAGPKVLQTEARLPGWTWFEPHHDAEKVVAASDSGILGVFGIRQARNRDQALFPLLGPNGVNLDPFMRPEGTRRGRSQVVHVQGEDFWVLAAGQLQRLQQSWSSTTGPSLAPVWDTPLTLGSPLHAATWEMDRRTGHSTLFLVTQPLNQQICLASTVDDERGDIGWQRQLGLVCQGEPLPLFPDPKAAPILLALDQGGGLVALDPDRFRKLESQWTSAGERARLSPALDENITVPPILLPGTDQRTAYEIANPGGGKMLVVRQVECDPMGRALNVKERQAELPGPLAGTPAIVGSWLVVPLAGGNLARLPLPLPVQSAPCEEGPDWRSRQAGPSAWCHILTLSQDRFLTTDGARGVTCWEWPQGKNQSCRSLPADRDPPTLDMRVVTSPLLIPGTAGAPSLVCLADAGGFVSLVKVRDDGGLESIRHWDLAAKVTGGPFLRSTPAGMRLGCLVEQNRLVWLDPTKDAPLWQYTPVSGEPIVGQPQIVDDQLIVADQSGLIVALDLANGQPVGSGFTLSGSLSAAASPIGFGPNRLFVPLSDGTVLLPALEQLRKR